MTSTNSSKESMISLVAIAIDGTEISKKTCVTENKSSFILPMRGVIAKAG